MNKKIGIPAPPVNKNPIPNFTHQLSRLAKPNLIGSPVQDITDCGSATQNNLHTWCKLQGIGVPAPQVNNKIRPFTLHISYLDWSNLT
jgi:hypothetical protein